MGFESAMPNKGGENEAREAADAPKADNPRMREVFEHIQKSGKDRHHPDNLPLSIELDKLEAESGFWQTGEKKKSNKPETDRSIDGSIH